MKRLLTSIATAFTLCVSYAPAAYAVAPCNQVVVDQSGLLTNADVRRVETAAQTLTAQGATVRVRVTSDAQGYSTLQAAADNVCGWANDRVVLWVTTGGDRDVGIYAGPAWNQQLPDSVMNTIIDANMMPGLESGAFANAFVQPINAMVSRVAPIAPGANTTTTTVVTQQPAANQWSFLTVAIIVGAIVLLIAGFFGLSLWTRRNRLRQAAVTVAQQSMHRLEQFNSFVDRIGVQLNLKAKDVLSDATVAGYRQRLESISIDAETANTDFNGHQDPNNLGYNFGAYDTLLESLQASDQAIDTVTAQFEALEKEIGVALLQAETAPSKLGEATTTYTSCLARVKEVKRLGYTVTAVLQSLGEQKAELDAAKALQDQKRYALAEQKLAAVVTSVLASAAVAEELPKLKAALKQRHAALDARLGTMAALIDTAADAFDEMEDGFASVGYESIAGNGTEAEVRIDDAEDMLDAALADIAQQKWEAAEQSLDTVHARLDQATQLLDAVCTQRKRLMQAKVNAPAELSEARRSAQAARDFVAKHRSDVSSTHRAVLENVEGLCDDVDALLAEAMPDYLKALKLAVRADEAADAVLESAIDEHEAVERKRRRAVSLRREAADSVDLARRYIDIHSSDVDDSTKRALSVLDQQLRALQMANDVDRVIALAKALDDAADSCLSDAQSDFCREERKREEAAEAIRVAAAAKAKRARQTRSARETTSTTATRTWGSSNSSSSPGATRKWRSSSTRSSGATRSFGSGNKSRSTGATRKW